jgi:uroporphyrinogen decarboxylase
MDAGFYEPTSRYLYPFSIPLTLHEIAGGENGLWRKAIPGSIISQRFFTILKEGGIHMTPRERVLKAFRKMDGYPDRVPVQFELCRTLLDHFGEKLGITPRYTNNLYEDVTYRISGNEIRTVMGCDVVVTGAGTSRNFVVTKNSDGTWLNEYGMKMRQGDIYVEVVEYPLAGAQTAADVKAYTFPDPHAPGRYDDAKDLVNKYHDEYFIIGDIEVTIFSLAHQLVGFEKLLLDMALGAEYLEPLFGACADFQIEVGRHLVELGVDALWAGDDFGSQTDLLMSPQMFRDLLKNHYIRMNKTFKQLNPDIIPILHCDGAVSKLLDDIYDTGFEVFNPVQPGVPGHGPKDLKDRFGDRFVFWGAIDQQELLPHGTDEELEADIKEKIDILGKNRGYMISPAHIIQADVSHERVEKFIELCKKHGSYA